MSEKTYDILDAFRTNLYSIKVSDGYNNDISPSQVTLKFEMPGSKTSLNRPLLILLPGDVQYTPLTTDKYTSGAGRNVSDGWNIAVIIYVNASSAKADIDAARIRERLMSDVKKAILARRRLGLDYVQSVYLRSELRDVIIDKNIYMGQVNFEVKFDFGISAP